MGHKHRRKNKLDLETLLPIIVNVLRQSGGSKDTKIEGLSQEIGEGGVLESLSANKPDLKKNLENLLSVISQGGSSEGLDPNIMELLNKLKSKK